MMTAASLLADGTGIPGDLIYIVVFLVISVVGGILGKKKQPQDGKQPRQGQRTPTPPRPPQASRPAAQRPAQSPPPTAARPLPGTPRSRDPRFEPPRRTPQVPPTPQRPVLTPHHPPTRRALEPVIQAELVEDQVEISPTAEEAVVVPEKARPAALTGVERAISNRSGLRTAFILSEILAPPVALRDNHPV